MAQSVVRDFEPSSPVKSLNFTLYALLTFAARIAHGLYVGLSVRPCPRRDVQTVAVELVPDVDPYELDRIRVGPDRSEERVQVRLVLLALPYDYDGDAGLRSLR